MMHLHSLDEGLEVFKSLSSQIRIDILKLLIENGRMNMNELATRLNVTNSAITAHIKKMEHCGLISVSNQMLGHGNEKWCSCQLDKILLEVIPDTKEDNINEVSIPIGKYSDYKVVPTCGIATASNVIGVVDDSRFFSHPDHTECGILWFSKGYVEYQIPNMVPSNHKTTQISISAEISSEAPGINSNWPSDIYFTINGVEVGFFTSPGDFGDIPGLFTPSWWFSNWNQYGLLKLLVINTHGTYIDGLKISDVTIQQLNLENESTIRLRISCPEKAAHIGGVTLFGKSFGNYSQDINIKTVFSEK